MVEFLIIFEMLLYKACKIRPIDSLVSFWVTAGCSGFTRFLISYFFIRFKAFNLFVVWFVLDLVLPVLSYLKFGWFITHPEWRRQNRPHCVDMCWLCFEHINGPFIISMQKSCKIRCLFRFFKFQVVSSIKREKAHNIVK